MAKGRTKWDWELKEELEELYNKYNGDIPKIAEAMELNYFSVKSAIDRFVKPIPSIIKIREAKQGRLNVR